MFKHLLLTLLLLALPIQLVFAQANWSPSQIDELDDVVITSVADNEVLTWDAATSKWTNQAGGAGSGDNVTVNSTAIDTTANIKDSTDITWAITDGGVGGPDDIAGTVVQAPKLTTARAINGTDFDGSANITIPVNNILDNSTSADYWPLWTMGQGTDAQAYTSTGLTYNPGSGLLSAIGFSGPLTGNASTVTNGVYTTNDISALAATTSAQLYGVLSDETGSDSGTPLAVFNQAPAIDGNIKNTPHRLRATIIDPLSVQTEDNEVCLWDETDAALTITKITVALDATTNEVAGDLKFADTFTALANPVVIETFDTTSGVRSDSSMSGDATVPAGKAIYLSFDSAPNTAIHQMVVTVYWDYD